MPVLSNLKRAFKQPYPFYFEGKSLLKLLVILGIMGIVFHYFFQPFSVYLPEHKMSYFMITVVHTAVALVAIIICSLVIGTFKSLTEFWTLGKEFLFLFTVLLVIGVGQFLIRDVIYDNPNNWSLGYFLEEVRNTFLVGVLFILILVPLNLNRLAHRNTNRAARLSPAPFSTANNPFVAIQTQVKQDDFELDVSALIFARAEGNYVVLHLNNNASGTVLKRIPLGHLQDQLRHLPYITRTHRSYLVNLNFLDNIAGNAQGYTLSLINSPEKIPVSRKMIPHFERALAAA